MSVKAVLIPEGMIRRGASGVEYGRWLKMLLVRFWAQVLYYRWPLLWVTVLEVLARLPSVTTTMYSIDGYQPSTYTLFSRDGRWGLALLYWLREQLGYSGIPVVPSSMVFAAVLFSGAGLLFVRFMLGRPKRVELFLFVALYTLHPFNTEAYTFSDITLVSAISTFIAAAGLACCGISSKPWLGVLVGTLLIFFALSINQPLLANITVMALLALVVRMFRGQRILFESENGVLSPPCRALVAAVVSALLYFLTAVVLPILMHWSLGRVDQRQTIDIGAKLAAFQIAFEKLLLPLPGFTTPLASDITIALLLLSTVAIFRAVLVRRGIALAVVAIILLATAAVCAVTVPVAAKDVWLVPRLLATFSLVSAGIITLGWHLVRAVWIKRAAGTAIAALMIGYVGTSNSILYDQHRINLWDMQEANRIVARLELNPNFSKVHSLALLYAFWSHPTGLTTAYGDLNISAFYPVWSKLGVIEEATGIHYNDPTTAELQVASKYCASAEIWPSPRSTTVTGELGVVCLGRDPSAAATSNRK